MRAEVISRRITFLFIIAGACFLNGSQGQTELLQLLYKKEKSVQDMAKRVKESYDKRCQIDCLDCATHSCYTLMDKSEMTCTYKYGSDVARKCDSYKRLVNFEQPTFRFSYGVPGNMEAICWMSQIKEDLIQVYQQDETNKRVYVSSNDGTMLTYPGMTQFCRESTYDARIRPWFVSASTGPKSVLLILDTSGSMEGARMEILKQAAKSLVDTLTLGDFFSIVTFSTYAISMTKGFLSANNFNKALVAEKIDQLVASGSTNYFTGFNLGFIQLEESINTDSFTKCSISIIFLTDGEPTDNVGSTLNLIQTKSQIIDFRLFTFSLGESADTVITKELACKYKGVWVPVFDLYSLPVQMSTVFDYFSTLNSQLNQRVVWSDIYEDASGAGKMVTASIAIYDKPINSSFPVLVAVAAIDVLVADIQKIEPEYTKVLSVLMERNSACVSFGSDECLLWKIRSNNRTFQELQDSQYSFQRQCQSTPPENCSLAVSTDCSFGVPAKKGSICGQLSNTLIPLSEKDYKKTTCCAHYLAGGPMAGIVIACIVYLAALVFLVFLARKKFIEHSRTKKATKNENFQMR